MTDAAFSATSKRLQRGDVDLIGAISLPSNVCAVPGTAIYHAAETSAATVNVRGKITCLLMIHSPLDPSIPDDFGLFTALDEVEARELAAGLIRIADNIAAGKLPQ